MQNPKLQQKDIQGTLNLHKAEYNKELLMMQQDVNHYFKVKIFFKPSYPQQLEAHKTKDKVWTTSFNKRLQQ